MSLFRSKAGSPADAKAPAGEPSVVLAERIAKLNAVRTAVVETGKDPVQTRAAERFVPKRRKTVLVTASGKKIDAFIINVSILGVAVDADFSKTKVEDITMVGSQRVEPGRRIMKGTVFLFEKPLNERSCGPDIIL